MLLQDNKDMVTKWFLSIETRRLEHRLNQRPGEEPPFHPLPRGSKVVSRIFVSFIPEVLRELVLADCLLNPPRNRLFNFFKLPGGLIRPLGGFLCFLLGEFSRQLGILFFVQPFILFQTSIAGV
ncbi:hypothetical protein LIER_34852 [Lithospermum erythrorhizon]|uniref:Maturase K n=1 Tax=Lithospermum erythrorhizon TaxID=34254 RepID=A0AAV3S3M1_LITER